MDEAANGGREGVCCMATWTWYAPETLVITGDGMDSQRVSIAGRGRPPADKVLPGTGWAPVPGAQWQLDAISPGVWMIAVAPQAATPGPAPPGQ